MISINVVEFLGGGSLAPHQGALHVGQALPRHRRHRRVSSLSRSVVLRRRRLDREPGHGRQGTALYATRLKDFRNPDAPKLPVDMHELVAMVAPRAILTIANTSIDRLGSEAGYVSMKAATEVYKALGVPDRIGFVQNPTGTHCAFPSNITADVQAFVDKFLAAMPAANTNIAKSPYNTSLTRWITWTTPTLQ
jgi:(4-O-methyl)-D-glucuronate---lignin esterase